MWTCKISAWFHSLTEMSPDGNGPDRNGTDRNGSDRIGQTETARPKSRVPPAPLWNKSYKRLRSRPKQPNTLSTNPCFFLLTFSRWTSTRINRASVQSHTSSGFFTIIMFLFTKQAIKRRGYPLSELSLSPCITCVQHSHAAKRLLQ